MSVNEPMAENETVPFYPDHVRSEVKVVIGITVIIVAIGLLGLLFPMGIGDPADPLNTPTHVKPEWYFLALYQLLKYIPKTIGAVIPVAAVALVFLWPFIERKPETSIKVQRVRLIVVIVGVIILILGTIWGEVS
jgi:quinol-cytochrome oxidoreductase complex cytochrome b subunit